MPWEILEYGHDVNIPHALVTVGIDDTCSMAADIRNARDACLDLFGDAAKKGNVTFADIRKILSSAQ